MVYWSLEPPLAERMELGVGLVCSLLANIHTDTKRGKVYVPSDFMPRFFKDPEEEEKQDEDDGMAPEKVMPVMEKFLERQQRRRSLQGKRQN